MREDDLSISPVTDLLKETYDFVIIAVEKEEMANEIKEELIALGIDKDKLLWREPIDLLTL